MIYDRLIAAGLPVLDRRVPGYKGLTFRPAATMLHHTASRGPTNLPSLDVCRYGRGEPNPLAGPLCQILIGRQGTICVITDGYANHAGRVREPYSNYNLVGVELENNGVGEPYPEAQLSATRNVCRALGFPTVLGHKEICVPTGRKIDPSFDMHAFRASLSLEEEVPLKDDERNALLNVNHWVKTSLKLGPYDSPMDVYGSFVAVQQTLTSLGDRIAALEARPPVVVDGGIDVDAIAKAVADKLAARLAD